MDVNQKNLLLAEGKIDRDDLWPNLRQMESQVLQFRFHFGLDELPKEPGLIVVRGPRQYGKSTWLELSLYESIKEFGKASAYYLNGDEIHSDEEFTTKLIELSTAFAKNRRIKRLFIDEVTAIPNWQQGIKRVLDRGILRDVLVITTGSKASDLRHGAERLPGRKGRLARTDYIFLPVCYRDFYIQAHKELGEKTWIAYLLSGGSPLALNDIYQVEKIPEYFIQLMRDWILGEVVSSGRNRLMLSNLLSVIFSLAPNPVGFAKLAREAGLANNTVASGYLEQLSDLLCVLSSWPWDEDKKKFILRKPCKFHFINLAAAVAFHPATLRTVADFEALDSSLQAKFLEWLVAQELWRRAVLNRYENPEALGFWQSKNHEIDFVTADGCFLEVKLGKTNPLEFSWFGNTFPKKNLTVISQSRYSSQNVTSMSIHEFLLSEPLDKKVYANEEIEEIP